MDQGMSDKDAQHGWKYIYPYVAVRQDDNGYLSLRVHDREAQLGPAALGDLAWEVSVAREAKNVPDQMCGDKRTIAHLEANAAFRDCPAPIKHPTREDAREAIRTLLWWIGDDPDRLGLIQTPERVLRAWEEDWGAGYGATFDDIKIFPDGVSPAYDQMVFIGGIEFASTCEHHLCAFTGHAAIAYIPKDGLTVGLSKLNRIVRHFSARLQVQERLTGEIAEYLSANLSPDCAVSMVATHMCIVSRGVRSASSRAITTALRGLFKDDPSTQAEFLHQARRSL